MWVLALMTGALTIFGTLSLAVFFDANHIPQDFKMNGPYYAFKLLGEKLGMGSVLMYVFAVVQAFFMLAQLAILIDAASRVFAGDVNQKYMPSWLTKKNKNGRPVHSYTLTAGISLVLLLLSGTLPSINSIYNWLLNLNGIVSPYKTCLVFVAFWPCAIDKTSSARITSSSRIGKERWPSAFGASYSRSCAQRWALFRKMQSLEPSSSIMSF